ncbi:MAG: IS110 family transposase [Pseudomonadota bacterium]
MQQAAFVIGVDVAKLSLVSVCHGQPGAPRSLANSSHAISAWLAQLPPGSIVAMEATGIHHRLLAQMAHAAGMRVYVLNARDVYFYAKALSGRAKTDRLDAAVIARYAAEHQAQLHAWQPAAGVEQQLHELLQRRARVTGLLVSLRQTLRDVGSLQTARQKLESEFDRFFEQIDLQLQALVASDSKLAGGIGRLRTIIGFGPQASIAVGALLSRIEFTKADALVAYSGLDPRPCDSGQHRGQRRLSKRGPAWLRRQMYLAAFAASHSRALKPLYESIKAHGFAPTQALVILARKLLRVAWAVWHSGKTFDPDLIGLQAACAKT